MGEVYKARDTRLDRTSHSRFPRSSSANASKGKRVPSLRSITPTITPCTTLVRIAVMEYIEGTPLKGPLPIDEAREYAWP
jgi:hypothetical protein